jgi:GDP-4-dehydro-6-deoxy-D-mannose reductase
VHVFVTGSRGFVGRHLTARLAQEGIEVTGRDRELDVTDSAAIEELVDRIAPDAIVHLAAQSSVAISKSDPALTHRVNYFGAQSVLRAALRNPRRPRVVLVGSSDQYGSQPSAAAPFTEDAPARPGSAYARSKAEADALAATYAAEGLEVVRVRAFSHTGVGQTDTFVLPSFARQIAEIERGLREPELRVGNLDSVRDYLDVSDVVDAYWRLLRADVPADAYNVASGVGVRIGDLLEVLLDATPKRPKVSIDATRFRPADFAVGDATRLRAATGWQPRIPIDDTLRALLDEWRARLSGS